MDGLSFGDRFRYRFDNFMARGTIAMIAALFAAAVLLIIVGALVLVLLRLIPASSTPSETAAKALWQTLIFTFSAGAMGNTQGRTYHIVSFTITIGGILIVSSLIGILAAGVRGRFGDLRRGRSRVAESGHAVILGWSPQVFTLVSELALANRFVHGNGGSSPAGHSACVAILADKDKVEMDEQIRTKVPDLLGTRVVCRSGSTLDVDDLQIVSPGTARAVIVVSPGGAYPDMLVAKTLMALAKDRDRRAHRYHIVTAIHRQANLGLARMIGGDEAQIFPVDDLIARVIAQTCREAGLSAVYGDLLSFKGAAIRFHEAPALAGITYGDALFRFREAALIGLRRQDGRVQINPPMETLIQSGDTVIAIATGDAAVSPSEGQDYGIDPAAIRNERPAALPMERLLILGWNHRGPLILQQLGYFMPPGSQVLVVAPAEPQQMQADAVAVQSQRLQVTFEKGNPIDRPTLERLAEGGYEYVIILSPAEAPEIQVADALTMVSLLHLRAIASSTGRKFAIVSEILDVRNRDLAAVTGADDVVISDRLIAAALVQLAENKDVLAVFSALLMPGGPEIFLKPAGEYITPDRPVNFYTVLEAARRKGQTAIGYRLLSEVGAPERAFGVHLNPDKPARFTLAGQDRIIVLEVAQAAARVQ
jgi:ion channel POLLUX/CASTOR